MSFLLNELESLTTTEQANLGNISDTIRVAGTHLSTIEAITEINGPTWKAVELKFSTSEGAIVQRIFGGTPKSQDAKDIEKANKANKRLLNTMGMLVKAAGFKDLKSALSGAVSGTDSKGNATTVFPKLTGKKLHVTTFTNIEPNKEGTQAYAKQEIDTYKFLDKDGKNGLGRDSLEAFDAEAKGRIEIAYGHTDNPVCIAKLNQLKEQALGTVTPQPALSEPVPPLTGMPEVATPIAQDDI